VLNLANTTLGSAAEPNLEESLYWRARALIALGDTESALKDLRTSLEIHPGFTPSSELLLQLGYNN
jgi:tetratricopeptide (TPR) repeat protein